MSDLIDNPDQPRRKKRYLSDPAGGDTPGYYDVPMLKPPVWKWEITAYFFLGGLSAGAYLLSRLAERTAGTDGDDESSSALASAGAVISALAAIPCAPLLIKDLGDPARFHHMLRVWKPNSPMNLGSWTLTGYSALSFLGGLRQWVRTPQGKTVSGWAGELLRSLDPAVTFTSDVAGIPLALLLAGYTGVLLAGSATPVWSRNLYLGPLFIASAMGSGASACHLALSALGAEESGESRAVGHIEQASHVAEAASLAAYLSSAGTKAEPLTTGPLAPTVWGGVVGVGLALPALLEAIPARGKVRKWLRVAASVAGLVGGIALRHALVEAGHVSAKNPKYSRP